MTIDDAIDIGWGIDKLNGGPRPTPQDALELIGPQLAVCDFNWLGGQEAQRVLREACSRLPVSRPMARTTLILDVEYDDQVTDPESLASAADRLLATVLSTPEILDEYANPHFGEFSVAKVDANFAEDDTGAEDEHCADSPAGRHVPDPQSIRPADGAGSDRGTDWLFPISFRQDSLGIDRVYVRWEGEKVYWNLRAQNDLAAFCNTWMENIKQQQYGGTLPKQAGDRAETSIVPQ